MQTMINIVRKNDFEKKFVEGLKLELDYELANLHDAMVVNNTEEIAKSKEKLKDLHEQLTAFGVFR